MAIVGLLVRYRHQQRRHQVERRHAMISVRMMNIMRFSIVAKTRSCRLRPSRM